jgi:hypothetical protein
MKNVRNECKKNIKGVSRAMNDFIIRRVLFRKKLFYAYVCAFSVQIFILYFAVEVEKF